MLAVVARWDNNSHHCSGVANSLRGRDGNLVPQAGSLAGEAHVSRNIIVCCDGTANEFVRDHTNVLKLFSILQNDPERQIAFYHPGLGTMEGAAALTSVARTVTKVLGLGFGY